MTDQQPLASNPLAVLRNVRPEQMGLPTPDDEWDVRALIIHVVQ